MKILLVGELSGFHNNLKKGLIKLGHEVSIAGTGDGWKKFPVDVDFSTINNNFFNKIYKNLKPLLNIKKLDGYDVVQFATPLLFNSFLNCFFYLFINRINGNNSYLCGISSNDPYYLEATKQMDYSPYLDFDDNVKERYYPNFSKLDIISHQKIINLVKCVIPSCYDYQLGYKLFGYTKLHDIIPFPFDVQNFSFVGNSISNNKIKIFHGISRAKNKGSKYIIDALTDIQKMYPNDVAVHIVERVPYFDYINLMNSSNIIMDQCLSYSYGMNALIGLSKGKIVLSGAEEIAIKALNLKSECPVINIKPDKNQIILELQKIISHRKEFIEMGEISRKFVEENHAAPIIAQRYIDAWKID